jgi:hypothetical protein
MEVYVYIIIAAAVFVFFLVQTIITRRSEKDKIQKKIRKDWGSFL